MEARSFSLAVSARQASPEERQGRGAREREPGVNKSEQVRGRRATRSGSAAKTVPLPELHPDPDGRYQPFPLSDVQQAYLTGRSEGLEPGSSGGHCYFEVDVADWDGERFEAALGRLIERHEMLRAVVRPDGRQQILPQVPAYRVERQDLRGQDPTAVQSRLEGLREAMSHLSLIHISRRNKDAAGIWSAWGK